MDPFLVQRVWAGSLESPAAAAAITQPAAAATDDPFSPFTDSEVAAAAAGYFPLPPAHAQHHHHRGGLAPFPSSFLPGGGGMAAEEDVRFELLMTGVASLVVVGMWVGGLVLWYIYCIRRPPRLFCGKGKLIQEVVAACPSLQRPYCPPVWCLSPWAQAGVAIQRVASIRAQLKRHPTPPPLVTTSPSASASALLLGNDDDGIPCKKPQPPQPPQATSSSSSSGVKGRRRPLLSRSGSGSGRNVRLPLVKEVVVLSDGQEVGLNWFPLQQQAREQEQQQQPPPRAVALLLHGVTGASHDHYELMERLAAVGILGVGFDRRGHGGLKLRRPRFNTTGDQEDLREVIDLISSRYPGHPLFAVGYSAGSSLLGRYLGEQGDDSHIDGAVLVSPGFDMEEAILMGHLHPLADYYLTQIAKGLFLEGLDQVSLTPRQNEALRRMKTSRSMREFHAEINHFSGHGSADEYFKAQNPAPLLKHIARPTLFINSHDDMMFPRALIRQWTWLAGANANVAMAQTRWGGHCCFYEGAVSLQPASWAEKVVKEFLTALVEREAPRMIERRISRTASRLQLSQLASSSSPLRPQQQPHHHQQEQAKHPHPCPLPTTSSSSNHKKRPPAFPLPLPPSPRPHPQPHHDDNHDNEEDDNDEEGWMLHNLSSHGSTSTSCSSLSLSLSSSPTTTPHWAPYHGHIGPVAGAGGGAATGVAPSPSESLSPTQPQQQPVQQPRAVGAGMDAAAEEQEEEAAAEAEEGRKEELKAVMTRAALCGWGLFITGVLGVLVAAEPFAFPTAAGAVI